MTARPEAAIDRSGPRCGARRRERLVQHLEESQRHLAGKNSAFLAETLPASEHWRLYDTRDVVNLEALLVKAYNLKAAQTPFGPTVTMPIPSPPLEPFQAHAQTIQRLMWQYAPFGF